MKLVLQLPLKKLKRKYYGPKSEKVKDWHYLDTSNYTKSVDELLSKQVETEDGRLPLLRRVTRRLLNGMKTSLPSQSPPPPQRMPWPQLWVVQPPQEIHQTAIGEEAGRRDPNRHFAGGVEHKQRKFLQTRSPPQKWGCTALSLHVIWGIRAVRTLASSPVRAWTTQAVGG